MNETKYSAGERQFIENYTRRWLISLCDRQLRGVTIPQDEIDAHSIYCDYAISKKWISSVDGKVLSTGFQSAARFLKR